MRRGVWLASALCLGLSTRSADACATFEEMHLADIFHADVVVLGDIRGYEIVGSRGSYARFQVRVDQVMYPNGAESPAPPTRSAPANDRIVARKGEITVTWVNSTYGLPDDLKSEDHPGFLLALRKPATEGSTGSEASSFIEAPDPKNYVVLQAHCSSPFIFEARSPIAIALQQVIETNRDPNLELEILEEFLFARQAFSKMEREIYMLKLQQDLPAPD